MLEELKPYKNKPNSRSRLHCPTIIAPHRLCIFHCNNWQSNCDSKGNELQKPVHSHKLPDNTKKAIKNQRQTETNPTIFFKKNYFYYLIITLIMIINKFYKVVSIK